MVEKEFVELFRSHGIRVWFDKDDVRVADYFERRILEGLKSCRWFLLAMSPHSAESEWVRDELHWAIENRPDRILPVMLDECIPEAFHVRLNRMYCPRYHRNPEAVRSQLIERLLASRAEA